MKISSVCLPGCDRISLSDTDKTIMEGRQES